MAVIWYIATNISKSLESNSVLSCAKVCSRHCARIWIRAKTNFTKHFNDNGKFVNEKFLACQHHQNRITGIQILCRTSYLICIYLVQASVTPLLTHWSYNSFALSHRYCIYDCTWTGVFQRVPTNPLRCISILKGCHLVNTKLDKLRVSIKHIKTMFIWQGGLMR